MAAPRPRRRLHCLRSRGGSFSGRDSGKVLVPGLYFGNPDAARQSSRSRAGAKRNGDAGRGFGRDYRIQDEVRAQRVAQITATEMLARLLRSGDEAPAVAAEYVDSLTEEFFQVCPG